MPEQKANFSFSQKLHACIVSNIPQISGVVGLFLGQEQLRICNDMSRYSSSSFFGTISIAYNPFPIDLVFVSVICISTAPFFTARSGLVQRLHLP